MLQFPSRPGDVVVVPEQALNHRTRSLNELSPHNYAVVKGVAIKSLYFVFNKIIIILTLKLILFVKLKHPSYYKLHEKYNSTLLKKKKSNLNGKYFI